MSQKLDRLEVHCDAPPYAVVHACRHAGFRTPEDVRWRRLPDAPHVRTLLSDLIRVLEALSGLSQTARFCSCGHILPPLNRYVFRRTRAKKLGYLLTQCPRCHTMLWDECVP
jgi:hypothetical protein